MIEKLFKRLKNNDLKNLSYFYAPLCLNKKLSENLKVFGAG